MAFTTNMSAVAQLDDRLIKLYDSAFIISARQGLNVGLDSLCTQREDFRAKQLSFTKYSKLTVQTSALDEDDDVTSEAMADAEVLLTPAEYGNVVTPTKLAVVQSGDVAAQAAFELAGINMAESMEKIQILRGEAGTNELIVTQSAESSLTASDIMTTTYVNRAYNKLRRTGIPKINNSYFAVAHDDVIHDVREGASVGDWVDVNKYSNAREIKENEVGMFGGFRWISSPLVSVNTDAGSTTVDTYHTQFFGFNAFGRGVSQTPGAVVSGPFDKLGRFVNIGWYGIFEYALIDSAAHWIVTSASSIGANT